VDPAGYTSKKYNLGGITVMQVQAYSTDAFHNMAYLLSGKELYSPSYLCGVKKNDQAAAPNCDVFALATYGST